MQGPNPDIGVWSNGHQPVRPTQGLHNGTWIARRRPSRPTLPHRPRSPSWLPRRALGTSDRDRGEEGFVTYADRTLTCVDCGVEFIHSAADQEEYVQTRVA